MHRDEINDLLDRRDVLLDTIAAGVSDRDRPFLDAELSAVRAALLTVQPISRGEGQATRNASPLH